MGYNTFMRVSEGLRGYYRKLFPDTPINEEVIREVQEKTWGSFYQVADTAVNRLGDLMVRVPADVLRKRNGTDSVPGDHIEACKMLIRAIGGVQALELVAEQYAAELDIFTPDYMKVLLERSGIVDIGIATKN